MTNGNWRECTDFFYSILVNEDTRLWVRISTDDAKYLLEYPDAFFVKVKGKTTYIEGKHLRTRHDGDCTFYSPMINERITDGICTCGYAHYWKGSNGCDERMYSKERLQIVEEEYKKRVEESGLTEPEYRHQMRQELAKTFGAPICGFCRNKMVDTFDKENNPEGDWTCLHCKQ